MHGEPTLDADGCHALRPGVVERVVYCATGMRSTTAASILERAGIGPVVNLRGGYGAWREAGRD